MKKLTYVVLQPTRVVPPLRQEKSPAPQQFLSSPHLPHLHQILVPFQEQSLESSDWPSQKAHEPAYQLPACLQIPQGPYNCMVGPSASREHPQ